MQLQRVTEHLEAVLDAKEEVVRTWASEQSSNPHPPPPPPPPRAASSAADRIAAETEAEIRTPIYGGSADDGVEAASVAVAASRPAAVLEPPDAAGTEMHAGGLADAEPPAEAATNAESEEEAVEERAAAVSDQEGELRVSVEEGVARRATASGDVTRKEGWVMGVQREGEVRRR